jgi:L-fuconolactonase
VDLTRADAGDQIARLHDADGGDRLVGIRHQVHDEPDRNWLASSDVRRGLSAVAEHELVYDLLVRTRELPAALSVSKAMPQLNFVIDHLAKPPIATGELNPWAQLITPFGELPNVSCKLSGMVTEARLTDWSVPNLLPYAQHVLEVFGPERVAFGSDWPVCLAAAPYSRVIGAVRELVDALSPAEQAAVMGATAARVYRLK